MCGAFPQHITANQFFTPRMFRAYHCEGYNACMEANAADFLNSTDKGNIFKEFQHEFNDSHETISFPLDKNRQTNNPHPRKRKKENRIILGIKMS